MMGGWQENPSLRRAFPQGSRGQEIGADRRRESLILGPGITLMEEARRMSLVSFIARDRGASRLLAAWLLIACGSAAELPAQGDSDLESRIAVAAEMLEDSPESAWQVAGTLLLQAEARGEAALSAAALETMGIASYRLGDFDRAAGDFEIRRQLGDRAGEAVSLNNLGNVARAREDEDAALDFYLAALAIREELGNKAGMTVSLRDIGETDRGA